MSLIVWYWDAKFLWHSPWNFWWFNQTSQHLYIIWIQALRRRRIWSAPPGRIQSAVGKVQSVKQRPISASAKVSTNSFCPNEAIWWHRSGSTLTQIMVCCLAARSHFLKQCWLVINAVLWHSLKTNFTWPAQDISSWNEFEIHTFKITTSSSRHQWVNVYQCLYYSHIISACTSSTFVHIYIIMTLPFCCDYVLISVLLAFSSPAPQWQSMWSPNQSE